MSPWDRIPPDHPLTEAARNVNAVAEERGLEAALEWLGMNISASQFAYLAEQRAIRCCSVIWFQHNMGTDPKKDELIAQRVKASPEWETVNALLLGAEMDGMVIGWQGHKIWLMERLRRNPNEPAEDRP